MGLYKNIDYREISILDHCHDLNQLDTLIRMNILPSKDYFRSTFYKWDDDRLLFEILYPADISHIDIKSIDSAIAVILYLKTIDERRRNYKIGDVLFRKIDFHIGYDAILSFLNSYKEYKTSFQ